MRLSPAPLATFVSFAVLVVACSTANQAVVDNGAGAEDARSDGRGSRGDTPPTVGVNGGTAPTLLFAVVGDTRPPTSDDVPGYPTTQITKIYQDISALDPRPSFVLGTGDYQFSSTGSGSTAAAQLAIYATARAVFPGPFFPAMGNHECTGGTASNCVPGGNGTTPNLSAFLSTLLAPLKQTRPYYAIRVDAADGSWTAKFVFVAANAWDEAQEAWLSSKLSEPTTYTFVLRHEPHDASTPPPGVAGSEALLQQFPYTLCIVGHSHTYGHSSDAPREVLFGNGGAPLSSKDFGYGLFARRSDAAIVVDAIDWQTKMADPYFHFAVKPDGTPTR